MILNKKLEQALEINNLNYEHFLTYCKKNKLNPNKISTRENFFREILVSQENLEEGAEISNPLPTSHMHTLPHYQQSPPQQDICYH